MNAEHILQALMRKEIRPDEAKALLASGKRTDSRSRIVYEHRRAAE